MKNSESHDHPNIVRDTKEYGEMMAKASKYNLTEIRRSLRRHVALRAMDVNTIVPANHTDVCRLFHGDCRKILPLIAGRPKFLFADPPFNISHNYQGYNDKLTVEEYARFTQEWIQVAEDCLAENGIMAINIPDDVVPLVLKNVKLVRIAWVIWHFRFGQCNRSNWINPKTHCLIFVKDPEDYTWNPDDVLVTSDRASKYNDKRTGSSATPGQRVPLDVWGIPSDGPYWGRVQGNNKERQPGHPNQLPEVYLERLIRAYTNPGDLVLDPFVGSGTTLVVAEALDRKSIGIDVSLSNIDSAFKRLQKGSVRVHR